MSIGGAAWLARVPWRFHLAGATICIFAVGASAWRLHVELKRGLQSQRIELRALERQQTELQSRPAALPIQSFNATLPSSRGSDDLVQFLSTQAKALNVQISAVSIQRSSASVSELGRVQLQASIRGTYAAIKSLFADLLGRYPSLGIQAVNLRARAQDATQTEAEVTLVWYVKD